MRRDSGWKLDMEILVECNPTTLRLAHEEGITCVSYRMRLTGMQEIRAWGESAMTLEKPYESINLARAMVYCPPKVPSPLPIRMPTAASRNKVVTISSKVSPLISISSPRYESSDPLIVTPA